MVPRTMETFAFAGREAGGVSRAARVVLARRRGRGRGRVFCVLSFAKSGEGELPCRAYNAHFGGTVSAPLGTPT